MKKPKYYEKALSWVKKKSATDIKAKLDGYEEPKSFTNMHSHKEIQADFSFKTSRGSKHYTDIALKTDNTQPLVTKWKLLSLMASMKKGKLHLLAPKGHKMFTQRLVNRYNINALVYAL